VCVFQEKQARSGDDDDDAGEGLTVVEPPLWKCYWTKMQLMMLLSGFFMLVGSLLHLACPLILIFIIDYVENKHNIDSAGGNVTLPKVWPMMLVCERVSTAPCYSNGAVLPSYGVCPSVRLSVCL